MSKPRDSREVTIDVNAVYTQLQALAEEISRLQAVEAQVRLVLDSIRRAKDTLDAFVRQGRGAEVLMPLDPQANGFGRVTIKDSDKFIISLGLGYYAELDASKGIEILSSKERALLQQLDALRQNLAEYSRLYQQYRQVLAAILASGTRRGVPAQEG